MNEAFSYSRAQIRAPNYGIWCCCLSPPGGSNQVREDNCRIVLTEEGLCRPKSHQQHASLTTKMPNGFCGDPRTDAQKNFFGGFPLLKSFSRGRKNLPFYAAKAVALRVSYEMSNIVQQCQISSPVVAVVGFWLFVGLGSLWSNCIYSLLYPEAWQHTPLLTSIIWL